MYTSIINHVFTPFSLFYHSLLPDIEERGPDNQTALMFACKSADIFGCNFRATKALIRKGADVNAKAALGSTALMIACVKGDLNIIRALISAGADVNAKTTLGNTALMIACEKGDLNIVRALISAGADVNAKDEKGRTALEIAHINKHSNVIHLLVYSAAE